MGDVLGFRLTLNDNALLPSIKFVAPIMIISLFPVCTEISISVRHSANFEMIDL